MTNVGKVLVENASAQLDTLLARFEVDSEEIKLKSKELAVLAIDITVAKMSGQDTTVAEASLVASTKNLVSAASVTLASSVLGFSQTLIRSVGATVIQIAMAGIA